MQSTLDQQARHLARTGELPATTADLDVEDHNAHSTKQPPARPNFAILVGILKQAAKTEKRLLTKQLHTDAANAIETLSQLPLL